MGRAGRAWSLAVGSALVVGLMVPAAADPAAPGSRANENARTNSNGIVHTGADYNQGRALPLDASPGQGLNDQPRRKGRLGSEVKEWLALDDDAGGIYLKPYTLRGVGDKIEVWVANDLAFPEGDPRNGTRTTITDEQVQYLIREFDTNMYPKESEAFSTPPKRNGSKAVLPGLVGLPQGYYTGQGDNIVVLVDNVVDDNYYDWADDGVCDKSYIAGFFYSIFNEYHDRNIMTIDAFDWLHRTTADPPNEPNAADPCNSSPARPFLYEGVFAHEYQHLLEYYQDPDETNWVNEGLSDWAQTLTGYVNPEPAIDEPGYDSHIQCFLGWLAQATAYNVTPRETSGPENSLTLWGDQGQGEILCDYGAAYTMMEYLHEHYGGDDFMSALHRDDRNGLESLAGLTGGTTAADALPILHDWLAMVSLDRALDNGATLTGGDAATYTTGTLDAEIMWEDEEGINPHAYDTPGAPPNGADFVRLRDGSGTWLTSGDITSIDFDGAESLPSLPIEWSVDTAPPGEHASNAFWSGSGDNFDRAMVQAVDLTGVTGAELTFDTYYDTEFAWDFGFVQVSTDGGATWTSLSNASTTSEHDPGAIAAVVDNLPGFTGSSGGWVTETFDLSAYDDQPILLSFRYITDSGVSLPGWWVDDVAVTGATRHQRRRRGRRHDRVAVADRGRPGCRSAASPCRWSPTRATSPVTPGSAPSRSTARSRARSAGRTSRSTRTWSRHS